MKKYSKKAWARQNRGNPKRNMGKKLLGKIVPKLMHLLNWQQFVSTADVR